MRRLLAITLACLWIAGCNTASSTSLNALPATGLQQPAGAAPDTNVNELPEAPVVRAVHGEAHVTLAVDLNPATGLPGFDYNGMHGVAPTVTVKPGETIVMDLTDNLPRYFKMASYINIHFHGMGSSPKAPGDDVLGTFATPGHSLHYVVHIPRNQGPGLYWYHPHIHGQTNFQAGQAGMSGAIVVEGLAHHIPGLAHMKQRVIVVRDTGVGANIVPQDMSQMGVAQPHVVNNNPCGPEIGLTVSLNDAVDPVITIAPGEQQFFRVVNATGHKTLKLAVDHESLELVAIDGFALDTNPKNPPTETVPYVIVPPAARAEFVVTGPNAGTTLFRTMCYDSGSGGDRDPNLELAKIEPPHVHRSERPAAIRPLTAGAALAENAYTMALPAPSAQRTVVFSEGPTHFFINGRAFKITDPPMYVVHTGTTEMWHIDNVTTEVHDFHIHQIHFLLEKVNGVKLAHPYWADSVVIPHRRANGQPGSIDALMDFMDPKIKGMFVFHCHILDHEDAGMMAKIEAI
ncbi:MAG TPA: multicopper oxidase domain-containing protein [Candidatus Tumulicola sp.]|nr:multicopper oxidase domain-containing protein [Candidatus Tumulicola sp.]